MTGISGTGAGTCATGLGGKLHLQTLEGLGEGLQVPALTLHGEGEGVGGGVVTLGQRLTDHAWINDGGFLGLALNDVPEVLDRAGEIAGDAQVVDAVDGLGSSDLLENLGDLGVALLHGPLGVGVVLQVGQGLGDDGAPEVFLSGGQGDGVCSHSDAPVGALS